MEPTEILAQARESMTVKRVFGDPIERDGATILPVANIMGGAGGGSGQGPVGAEGSTSPTAGSGSGGGFGVRATPAGVYEIRDGRARWIPALDVTRLVVMGQVVAIVFLLVVRSVVRSRGD